MDEQPKKLVEFSAKMRPSALLRVDGQPIHEPAADFATRTGMMVMSILSMSHEDKLAYVTAHVADPLVVWFTMLTSEERRQIVKAAEESLRQKVTE